MGKKTQKTTSTQTTRPPQYIEDAYKGLLSRAQGVADTPYSEATERQVAGFTAPQTQAFQNVQNIQGIQNPYIGQAADYANSGASTITADNIGQYLNPYQNQVIDSTLQQIGRNNAMQQGQLTGNAALKGALGGDRVGVAQAELARNQDMTTADVLSRMNSQNYNQALSAAQADKSRQFQGAQMSAALGNQAQQAGYQDIGSLLGIGSVQQQQQQSEYDTATGNAQQQQQYPFNTTQWLAGITQGLGSTAGGTTNGVQTTPGPSVLSQIAGLGLAGAGLMSGFPGASTALGTTLSGMFGGSRNLSGLAAGGMVDGDLNGDGTVDHIDDLIARAHKAAQGIGAIQKAVGGRTEPKGIGAPLDMKETSPGNWEASKGFAAGGFPDDDDDDGGVDLFKDPYGDEDGLPSIMPEGIGAPMALPAPAVAASPDRGGWAGLGVPREKLPAGMRNNNPGNIKFVKGLNYPGLVGPSENTDQGDPQMVFTSPAEGMRAASSLAMRKYQGGKRTANDLIAGNMGWTPGNTQAAANIARNMGVDPNEDLRLDDPARMQGFLRALTLQEHGNAAKLYGDDVYGGAVTDAGAAPSGPRQAQLATASGAVNDASPPQVSGLGASESAPAAESEGWSPNIPLLAAGLGILSSKSPFPGVAIGEGGLKGVEALMTQRKTEAGAKKLAEAAKIAQQRLGIQVEAQKARTEQAQAAQEYRERVLEERRRHNEAVEAKGGAAAFSKNVIRGTLNGKPALIQPGSEGKAVLTELPKDENGNVFEIANEPIKVDAGTKYVLLDPQTRQVVGEIPKNVQEEERNKAAGQVEGKTTAEAKTALPNIVTTTERVLNRIDRLDQDPMRSAFTGYSGYLPNLSPKANSYQALLKEVQGNVFLQAFASLKGAGAITEMEGQAATAALSRLQAVAPSDEGYQSALDDTRQVMRTILKNARERAGVTEASPPAPADDASAYKQKYGLD